MRDDTACAPMFVVGTGRCGSTMLSYMLRDHLRVLSLSEFFAQMVDGSRDAFSLERVNGQRFFAMISAIGATNNFCMRHGIVFPEWLYPYDAPTARFSSKTGVPAILLETLPLLTDNHDALFEMLRDEITAWPAAMIAEQYQRLFNWLAEHFGKRIWVERSGSSLIWTRQLLKMFPDARFIHIVRDGRDAALSMQEHPAFRFFFVMGSLAEFLGVHPIASLDRSRVDQVPAALRPFLPEEFDIDAFAAYRIPAPLCGRFWTQQIVDGLNTLDTVPADRLLTVRYENFFDEPKKQLDAICSFLGDEFVDDAWSARCAATIRKPRAAWRDLPDEAASALTDACRPGFQKLRDLGVHYGV